jgi:hypothetical protein
MRNYLSIIYGLVIIIFTIVFDLIILQVQALLGRFETAKNQQEARVISLFSTIGCRGTSNVKCNWCTATPFQRNRFTEATGWAWSFVRRV